MKNLKLYLWMFVEALGATANWLNEDFRIPKLLSWIILILIIPLNIVVGLIEVIRYSLEDRSLKKGYTRYAEEIIEMLFSEIEA